MKNEKLISAKKLYDALIEFMDNPSFRVIFFKAIPQSKHDPSEYLFLDTLQFMSHISRADGQISQRETNVINYITQHYLSTSELNELNLDISPTEIPITVMLLCEMENLLFKNNQSVDCSLMNMIISYYETIGEVVAEADNNFSSTEISKISSFISNIKGYVSEHTLSPFFNY